MADIRAVPLVTTERASLSDDFVSFGPDAPTILDWDAQGLLEHLILRERRPHLLLGERVPVQAVSDWMEGERAKLREKDWAEQVEIFRRGPGRFSPVRAVDRQMNTAEYFIHHEDLLRARPGWNPRNLGDAADRELWGSLKHAGRMIIRTEADLTLVSPLGGLRLPGRRSEGSVSVHGPVSELMLWAFGRDRVARVSIEGAPEAIALLRTSDRSA